MRPRLFHRPVYLRASLALSLLVSACTDPASVQQPASFAAAKNNERPNIIVVFTDDQGYTDLGVQGIASDVATPHIDQLAADGIRMTAGYSTAPQCTPSRAALITGRYQQKFGVDDNDYTPMPRDEITLAERLRDAGYRTGMVGKWHLEANRKSVLVDTEQLTGVERASYFPDQRGFDDVYVGYQKSWRANYDLSGNTLPTRNQLNEDFRLDVATDAALTFIDRHQHQIADPQLSPSHVKHRVESDSRQPDSPFFLYLSYYAPHLPLEAPQQYLSRFADVVDQRRRYALAMMAAIDDGVGRIRERLDQYGLTENTLLFFISDNGAPLDIYKPDLPIDDPAGEWDGSLNDPWVGEKGMLTEGGIRVPYIVSWPSKLPAGQVFEQSVSTLDVVPTSMAAAQVSQPGNLDGVDLLPYFLKAAESQALKTSAGLDTTGSDSDGFNSMGSTSTGLDSAVVGTSEVESLADRSLYWRFWSQAAIRKGRWKYLLAGDREFLFDLESAEHETLNLIDLFPVRADELKSELVDWSASLYRPGLPVEPLNQKERAWFDFYLGEGG